MQEVVQVSFMSRDRKRQGRKNVSSPERVDAEDMGFDVMEWLEVKHLEHERRMQKLGCSRSLGKGDRPQ